MTEEVNHANTVTNADHVEQAEHVDRVSTLSISTQPQTKDERTLAVLRLVLAVLATLAVLGSAATAGYVLISRNQGLEAVNTTLNETKVQLSLVQSQLAEAKKQLDESSSQATAQRDCLDTFSRNISSALADDISGLLNVLFVLGAPDPPGVVPSKADKYATALAVAQQADASYHDALTSRDEWVEAQKLAPDLACPV